MANLTVVIDDAVLQAARVKALQLGTSVNAICRDAITRFAGEVSPRGSESIAALRELARRAQPSTRGQRAWPGRDALYDQVLRERGAAAAPPRRRTR